MPRKMLAVIKRKEAHFGYAVSSHFLIKNKFSQLIIFSFATNIRILHNRTTDFLVGVFFLVFHNKSKSTKYSIFLDIQVTKTPTFESR